MVTLEITETYDLDNNGTFVVTIEVGMVYKESYWNSHIFLISCNSD